MPAFVLAAAPVEAHHSPNIYDRTQDVTLEGVVTSYEWANPHVYVYMENSDSGSPIIWELENGPTTMMKRRGWSGDSYVAGDRIVVRGYPARDPNRHMILVTAIEKSDTTLYSREGMEEALRVDAGPRAEATSLAGNWAVPLSTNEQFSAAAAWPLTEKGAAALAAYDDETMNPQIQCLARTTPWVMIFPAIHQIEISEQSISIRSEYDTVERIIYLDADTHDGAAVTHQGHSIGRWENDALIVDTTHFADHRNGIARGIPSGRGKHVIERFELNADRTSLTYRYEVSDPEYLTETIVGEMQWAYRPDLEFTPIGCDFENARRFTSD